MRSEKLAAGILSILVLVGWGIDRWVPAVYVIEQWREIDDDSVHLARCLASPTAWTLSANAMPEALSVGDEIKWFVADGLPTVWKVQWLSQEEGMTLQAADGSRAVFTVMPDEGSVSLALELSTGDWPWERVWARWQDFEDDVSVALDERLEACRQRKQMGQP